MIFSINRIVLLSKSIRSDISGGCEILRRQEVAQDGAIGTLGNDRIRDEPVESRYSVPNVRSRVPKLGLDCPVPICAYEKVFGTIASMKVGYIRTSKKEQNPDVQRRDLEAFGCEKIFEEQISSRKADQPELWTALDFCREGDELVVWKLDRFGRSLQELIELVGDLKERGIEFISLRERLDNDYPGRKAGVPCLRGGGRVREGSDIGEDGGGAGGGEGARAPRWQTPSFRRREGPVGEEAKKRR